MACMGIIMGLFSIVFQSNSPDALMRAGSKVTAFILGFAPCIVFALVVWLVAGKNLRERLWIRTQDTQRTEQ